MHSKLDKCAHTHTIYYVKCLTWSVENGIMTSNWSISALQFFYPDRHPHLTTVEIFLTTPKLSVKEWIFATAGLHTAGSGMSGKHILFSGRKLKKKVKIRCEMVFTERHTLIY